MNADSAPTGQKPQTQPTNLAANPLVRLLPSPSTITTRHNYSAQKLMFILPSSRWVEGWVSIYYYCYCCVFYRAVQIMGHRPPRLRKDATLFLPLTSPNAHWFIKFVIKSLQTVSPPLKVLLHNLVKSWAPFRLTVANFIALLCATGWRYTTLIHKHLDLHQVVRLTVMEQKDMLRRRLNYHNIYCQHLAFTYSFVTSQQRCYFWTTALQLSITEHNKHYTLNYHLLCSTD